MNRKRRRKGFGVGSPMVRFGFSMGAPLERTYSEPTPRPKGWEKVVEMLGKKCSPISGVERLRLGGETIKDATGDTQ